MNVERLVPGSAFQTFSVHWGADSSKTIMEVTTCIDGLRVNVSVHKTKREGCFIGVREGTDRRRELMFIPLVVTGKSRLDVCPHSRKHSNSV